MAVKLINISEIRRDGGTQGRIKENKDTILEYAELMKAGVAFPAVRVWIDGNNYWLSDGFQRIAAAELSGATQFAAEVLHGSREDAIWDSFSANSVHGLRRTKADLKHILQRALGHPQAAHLSNSQLARHLGVPETTLRRWKQTVPAPPTENGIRIAIRNGKPYSIQTDAIGKHGKNNRKVRRKTQHDLRVGLREMKSTASLDTHRILNAIGNWMLGDSTAQACVKAIENVIDSQTGRDARKVARASTQSFSHGA